MPSFYQPRDSRFRGEGVNFGFNFKIDDFLSLGYRAEVLHGRGQEAVAGAMVAGDVFALSQGLAAYQRIYTSDNEEVGMNLGLWAGAAIFSSNIPGVSSLTSPFIEPLVMVLYGPTQNKDAQIKLGVGYRFIRGFTPIPAPFGGASATLVDLDGLDITLGVGISF